MSTTALPTEDKDSVSDFMMTAGKAPEGDSLPEGGVKDKAALFAHYMTSSEQPSAEDFSAAAHVYRIANVFKNNCNKDRREVFLKTLLQEIASTDAASSTTTTTVPDQPAPPSVAATTVPPPAAPTDSPPPPPAAATTSVENEDVSFVKDFMEKCESNQFDREALKRIFTTQLSTDVSVEGEKALMARFFGNAPQQKDESVVADFMKQLKTGEHGVEPSAADLAKLESASVDLRKLESVALLSKYHPQLSVQLSRLFSVDGLPRELSVAAKSLDPAIVAQLFQQSSQKGGQAWSASASSSSQPTMDFLGGSFAEKLPGKLKIPPRNPTQNEVDAASTLVSISPPLPSDDNKKRKRRNMEPACKEFVEPADEDVLCGRGGRTNHNPGNKKYLIEKDKMQEEYLKADKHEKTELSQKLVDMVKDWGGRFLKMDADTQKWYKITDHAARKKASQSLREVNTPEERARKRARYRKEE